MARKKRQGFGHEAEPLREHKIEDRSVAAAAGEGEGAQAEEGGRTGGGNAEAVEVREGEDAWVEAGVAAGVEGGGGGE